jgi:topoisomerase-4 subunit A
MSLDKGEKPLSPAPLSPTKVGSGETAAAVSASGRLLLFPLAELKTMAKGRGTIIQALDAKDELAAVAVGTDSFIVSGAGRGGKPTDWKLSGKDAATYRGQRARKGHAIPSKIKPTGLQPVT